MEHTAQQRSSHHSSNALGDCDCTYEFADIRARLTTDYMYRKRAHRSVVPGAKIIDEEAKYKQGRITGNFHNEERDCGDDDRPAGYEEICLLCGETKHLQQDEISGWNGDGDRDKLGCGTEG